MPVALHLAPHPDDELLGAGATLLALRDAGWRVVNLACTLGSDGTRHEAREAELREACARAGFDVVVARRTAPLAAQIEAMARVEQATLVVSPVPGDRHLVHEQVAIAAEEALGAPGAAKVRAWWQWALWGELEDPNLLVPFGAAVLERLEHALRAHAGELARNDYVRLARGRALVGGVLGPEKVFGHGTPGLPPDTPYADVLTALEREAGGRWRLATEATYRGSGPPVPAQPDGASES